MWIGLGLSALVLALGGLTSGIPGLLMIGGLVALGTGLYALIVGRPSWLGLAGRRGGAVVTIVACAMVITGTGMYGAQNPPDVEAVVATAPGTAAAGQTSPTPTRTGTTTPTPTATPSSTPTSSPSPTPTHTPTPSTKPTAGTALALLATIPVKGRAPKTGYDRPVVFGHAWKDVDRNGCDTRNDILRRDLTAQTIKPETHGCLVLTGILADPYTGHTIHFRRGQSTSTAVQIDHVVALMNAWQSGAQQLAQNQREALANDPVNLLAVDGPTNERKGAGDAATWLPPVKSFRCTYVARQITVKAKYHLWVTRAEHDAMTRILSTCPGQKTATAAKPMVAPVADAPAPKQAAPKKTAPKTTAPKKAAPKTTAPKTIAPKKAKPVAPAPKAPTPTRIVHPGSYCTPEGARGVTKKGTPMVCSPKNPGDRNRWRSAG